MMNTTLDFTYCVVCGKKCTGDLNGGALFPAIFCSQICKDKYFKAILGKD